MTDDRGFLLPDLDDDSEPFWAWCRQGELRVQRCAGCGRRRFPPRPMCPHCRSFDHEWNRLSGTGTVWSFAIPHPPLLPPYTELAPYNVVVVAMTDEPTLRMVGNVVDTADGPLNGVDPHSVEIGEVPELPTIQEEWEAAKELLRSKGYAWGGWESRNGWKGLETHLDAGVEVLKKGALYWPERPQADTKTTDDSIRRGKPSGEGRV